MTARHKLVVGACGWEHPGWHGRFYPEDLPEDWRLSYYANEFTGVLLPECVWRAADNAEFVDWCDDVSEGFLFFLQTPTPAAGRPETRSLQEQFGTHWGGWSDGATLTLDSARGLDLKSLGKSLQRLVAESAPGMTPGVFLRGEPPDIEQLRQLRLLAEMI